MELNNYKNYKYINNTHDPSRIPGFDIGKVDTSVLPTAGHYNMAERQPMIQKTIKDMNNLGSEHIAKVKNTGSTNTDSKMDIGGAITAAPDLFKNMYSSWSNYDDVGELIASANTTQMYKNGIGYQTRQLTTAKDGKLPGYREGTATNIIGSTASGAQIGGSIVPGWGHAIGAAAGLLGSTFGEIFSSNKQKNNKNIANKWLGIQNNAAEDNAYSTYLSQYNAKKYGDSRDMLLRGFSSGKQEDINPDGFTKNTHVLHTINGVEVGRSNAKVEPEEYVTQRLKDGTVIGNRYDDGKIRSKRPGDILYTVTNPNQTIWTNNIDPATGVRFSDEAEARVAANMPLDDLQYRMAQQQAQKNKKPIRAKCGKLPGHAEGWMGNAFPALVGGIAGLGQYLDAKNNKPYYPNTYVANPYENAGLSTLAGLRVNPYPIMNQLRSAEARTNRAIDIAGGLSGAQRAAARLANLNTTQSNISNLLSSVQQQNNAYRANYAQAAINAGQASRQARMQANQWDLDMYAKAHAARNKGMQTGIANMLAQIQQYQANEFKRRQFNDTMALYKDDMDLRKRNANWMQNQATRGIGYYPMYNDPTDPVYGSDDDIRRYISGIPSVQRKRLGITIG